MAGPDLLEIFCDSGNFERSYIQATWFDLYLVGIEFRRLVFTVSAKSYRLFKNIGVAALLLCFTVASCNLVEKPLNEAVMVYSDPVEFKCKSDHGCRLEWWTEQSPSRHILFNGYSISKEAESFCSVENEVAGGFYLNLTIKHESAQTYICYEPDTRQKSSADLIIIEHEAQCKTVYNTSHAIMTCDLEFRGNWVPELEWSYNGTLITEGVNASIVSNKSVNSTLTVPLSADVRNYTCTTRFDIGRKPNWTTSNNVPDYVSNSVVTVKANQEIAEEQEEPSSTSGISSGWWIGITVVATAAFVAVVMSIIFLRLRKRRRNKKHMMMEHMLSA